MALSLPEGRQKGVQGGSVPLVADAREQAGLDGPDVGETVLHLAGADALKLGAGAVVVGVALALDRRTADESGGCGEEGDEGSGGEEHCRR